MKKNILFVILVLIPKLVLAQPKIVVFDEFVIPIGFDTSVVTGDFTAITNTSVRLELMLASGADNTQVWIEVDTSDQLQCVGPNTAPLSGRINGGDSFQGTVSGLVANTQYYFRACSLDSRGAIVDGELRSFLTSNTIDVNTVSAVNVSNAAATLRGRLIAGRDIDVWFVLSDPGATSSASVQCGNAPPTNTDVFVVSAGDDFSEQRQNLLPDSRYFYRVCARNSEQTVQGLAFNFTTGDANTEVMTLDLLDTDIGVNDVTLRGEVTSGTEVVASFILDDTSNIACLNNNGRPPLANGQNTGDVVTANFDRTNNTAGVGDELLSNTTYFYIFCARNARTRQVAMGEVKSFVTQSDSTALSISQATDITTVGATFTGSLLRAANPIETWFVREDGDVTLDNAVCQSADRLSVTSLSIVGDTNVIVLDGLNSQTTHTVGFCGEGESGNIFLAGQTEFTTL